MTKIIKLNQYVKNHYIASVYFKMNNNYILTSIIKCGPTKNINNSLEIVFDLMQNENWWNDNNIEVNKLTEDLKRCMKVGDRIKLSYNDNIHSYWECAPVDWKEIK